jgi:hypothetical protein
MESRIGGAGPERFVRSTRNRIVTNRRAIGLRRIPVLAPFGLPVRRFGWRIWQSGVKSLSWSPGFRPIVGTEMEPAVARISPRTPPVPPTLRAD